MVPIAPQKQETAALVVAHLALADSMGRGGAWIVAICRLGAPRKAVTRSHFLPFTWLSSSEKPGRTLEKSTLRPNSIAVAGL